jgi:hypothetical protein
MTTADERYRALARLPHALTEFAARPGPIKKKELRRLVSRLLRHYPFTLHIDRMAECCPDILKRTP